MSAGLSTDAVLVVLTTLSRQRALTEQESRRLERAIRADQRAKGFGREYWAGGEDRRLKQYLARGKRPRQIAHLMGRTEQAIWSRVRCLRRRGELGYLDDQHFYARRQRSQSAPDQAEA